MDVAGGLNVDTSEDTRAVPEPAPAPGEAVRTVEALLFLSPDPLTVAELAEVAQLQESQVQAALANLAERYRPGERGVVLRELAGGHTFTSDPSSEDAARRLFSRPRVATLSPAQAETLAIVAYLQPVSRPEITRIRGVSTDSATVTLLERGLIEEAGRSQFGAVLYRTSTLFLKLFGLRSLDELPDIARWDPTPQEQAELRERLLRAGDVRGGGGAPASDSTLPSERPPVGEDLPAGEDHPVGEDTPSGEDRSAGEDPAAGEGAQSPA